jgi:hypothetical protein
MDLETPLQDLQENIQDINEYAHSKIKIRLIIYIVIALAMYAITIYYIAKDEVGFTLPILGALIGLGGGYLTSRIFKIKWDKRGQQVISEYDFIGGAILGLYVIFEIYRDQIVGYFIQGPAVVAVSFAVLGGIMIGRILGISRKVNKIIQANA